VELALTRWSTTPAITWRVCRAQTPTASGGLHRRVAQPQGVAQRYVNRSDPIPPSPCRPTATVTYAGGQTSSVPVHCGNNARVTPTANCPTWGYPVATLINPANRLWSDRSAYYATQNWGEITPSNFDYALYPSFNTLKAAPSPPVAWASSGAGARGGWIVIQAPVRMQLVALATIMCDTCPPWTVADKWLGAPSQGWASYMPGWNVSGVHTGCNGIVNGVGSISMVTDNGVGGCGNCTPHNSAAEDWGQFITRCFVSNCDTVGALNYKLTNMAQFGVFPHHICVSRIIEAGQSYSVMTPGTMRFATFFLQVLAPLPQSSAHPTGFAAGGASPPHVGPNAGKSTHQVPDSCHKSSNCGL
jgi:hypothetical protein